MVHQLYEVEGVATARSSVVTTPGSARRLVERAISDIGALATSRLDSPVVVVPQLGAFALGSPAAANPLVVESLIDVLYDHGLSDVAVGAFSDDSTRWAGNRDAYALVELLGYRFETPNGRDYDVIDLGDDLVDVPFQAGDVLHGLQLNKSWCSAGLRIVVAANTTHDAHGYHLGLGSLLQVIPLDSRLKINAHPGEMVAELARVTPAHVTIIDGLVSAHGSGGQRAPRPITTDTIIAADDIWLADTVGAIKMGLDPGVSPLFREAPEPGPIEISGSLDPYEGFEPPHPLMLAAMSQLDTSPWLSSLIRPWLQILDPDLFPLESPLDARLNERLAQWFDDVDNSPVAFGALVATGFIAGAAQKNIDTWRILYDKDSVRRRHVSLGFEPDAFSLSDYTSIVAELEALNRLLDGAVEHRPGLRWRYLNDAVLFDYQRLVPVDFEQFTAAVDVAKAISYMNDYLGGVVVTLDRDAVGRSVRQAERNLYLPQPNYLALADGKPIDVQKLEIVEYQADRHRLYWKTIASPNDSATYDDGTVTFQPGPGGSGTLVTIFGRQLFTLPQLWAAIDDALAADLKAHLVTDAYATFFDRTIANFEALVEGRDIRIGTRIPEAAPLPATQLEELAEAALGWLQQIGDGIKRDTAAGAAAEPVEIDGDGFRHFQVDHDGERPRVLAPIVNDAAGFWRDLVEAGLRDIGVRA